jgi:hypothetical protein
VPRGSLHADPTHLPGVGGIGASGHEIRRERARVVETTDCAQGLRPKQGSLLREGPVGIRAIVSFEQVEGVLGPTLTERTSCTL